LLALLALAGPATPAHADTLPAFSLTSEASDHEYASPGQELVVPWFVEDSGSDPLSVTMSLTELVPLAWKSPAISWTSLSPSQLTLDSGQSADVQVTVDVPPGTPDGKYAVNIMASASLPGCSGVCVGGAVAGTLVIYVAG
jgi:hypothetical protein